MVKNPPQHVLRKVAFQATFKPNLKFYNLLYSATEKLSSYEHWETNRLYVFLHDYDKRCTLAVRHNTFSYEWDYGGTSNYEEDIQEALEILPEALEIETFKRLGFRQQFLIPTHMSFEEINNILNVKFLSQNEGLINLFPSGITDMTYVVIGTDGTDDKLELRVAIGPMRKKEISNHIQINQKYNFSPDRPGDYASVLSSYPEVSVFVDIDIFRRDDDEEGIPASYGLTFLKKADAMLQDKLSALKNYIFSSKDSV